MRWILIIYFLLSSNISLAQTLYGSVTDSLENPLFGASLVLLDSAEQILTYGFSNEKGNWELSYSQAAVQLKINYLAYQELSIQVSDSLLKESIRCVLTPLNNQIEEIIINAERITKVEKGDTTIFNIQHYKSETDQTFGDLLDKVPGFEVTESGQIKYNGKRVDQLLLEGKDILNNQHELTTQNLSAEDIQKVEVIENYKPFNEQLSKIWSDKIALNLVMTEDAKGTWSGDIALSVGLQSKYESELTVIKVNKKIGTTNFLRSNNLGEPTIALEDFIYLQSSLISNAKRVNQLSDLIPDGFQKADNEQKSIETLLASNWEIDFKGGAKGKASILSSYFLRGSMVDQDRRYLRSNDLFVGQNNADFTLPYFSCDLTYQKKINDKSTLEIDVPIHHSRNIHSAESLGFLNNLSWISNWNSFRQKQMLNPRINWNRKVFDSHLLKFSTQFSHERKSDELSLELPNVFGSFPEAFSPQKNQSYENLADVSLIWAFYPNAFHFEGTINYKIRRNSIIYTDSISTIESPRIKSSLNNRILHSSLKVSYQEKDWLIRYIGTINNENVELIKETWKYDLFEHELQARYNFSRLHFLLIKAGLSQSLTDPLYSLRNFQLINDYTLLVNDLQFGIVNRKKNVVLTYFWFNPLSSKRVFSSLSIENQGNPLVFTTRNQKEYIIQAPQIIQSQSRLNWTIWAAQNLFDSKIIFRIEGQLNLVSFKDRDAITELNQYMSRVNFKSNFRESFNFMFEYGLSAITQKLVQTKGQFLNHSFKGSIRLNVKKLFFKTDLTFILGQNNSDQQRFIIWNGEALYPIDKKWTVRIAFRDILNLMPNTIFNTTFNWQYQETNVFQRFPGSIVLGIKYGI
ncbi:MAG: hypothetical protein MK226_01045 [Saprospiraceae bacterium]|nr:hypothetical protein [Saprospiraceae bacterium]